LSEVEARSARVPQQLISPDEEESGDKKKNETDGSLDEFSGAGAIVGYALPLGASNSKKKLRRRP
jgi:hypothetical protein